MAVLGDGMSDSTRDDFPLCACGYFDTTHHPQCPARNAYESLKAEVERLTIENAQLKEIIKCSTHRMDEVIERFGETLKD